MRAGTHDNTSSARAAHFPAQAQFFLGEIFRVHYESIELDGSKTTDKLAEDLEYKSELLLSSQGHYLRAIRIGSPMGLKFNTLQVQIKHVEADTPPVNVA